MHAWSLGNKWHATDKRRAQFRAQDFDIINIIIHLTENSLNKTQQNKRTQKRC